VFIDGRALPSDPDLPAWLGYSVGHWEGDALVVETSGFNNKSWLDAQGHPQTEKLRLTERFRRRDFGHLELQLTIDDPGAYKKPWTVSYEQQLVADTDILESFCENERDRAHLIGRVETQKEILLPTDVLRRYAGLYEIAPGQTVHITLDGTHLTF